MSKILQPDQSFTFSKFFELKVEIDDLVDEFGYVLARTSLPLPQYTGVLDRLSDTYQRIAEALPFVNLANETTRREVLIAPIMLDLIHYTKSQLKIEYPIKVNEYLQGYVDYLLKNELWIIVIEAKHENLYAGFTQLAVELIALDQWENTPRHDSLFGAVTTGSIWQFGLLHRQNKLIQQDLTLYRVPTDFEVVMRILVEALGGQRCLTV